MLSSLLGRRRAIGPVPVYLVLMAGQAVCFSLFFTIHLVYQVTVIGLDPFQMVLVGVVLEVTCFLFEVPTGVVADVYSRRLSIIVGFVLIGCAYLLEGAVPAFWAALAGQVFWGLGYTFTSGATQAWITDEIGEAAVGPVFLRGEQVWLIGGLVGTALATALGTAAIQAPMLLAGVGMAVLAGTLALVMPERHMHPAPAEERSTVGHIIAIARDGLRLAMARPVARSIIAISLVTGLSAEAFDRLSVPLVIDRFAFPTIVGVGGPVAWFGISGVVGTLLGLAASEVFRRTNPAALGAGAPARLLAALAAADIAALAVFAVAGNLWLAFAMIWARRIIGAVAGPVQDAWLNRNLDPATRATVISMTGQANAIGQATGGPAFGLVARGVSIPAALLASAVVLSPVVALFLRLIAPDRGAAGIDGATAADAGD